MVPLAGSDRLRADAVSREILTSVLCGGGPGWEAALEPFLTEMANDRVVGALATLRLAQVAALALCELASAELESPDDVQLLVERALASADRLLDRGQSGP